MDFVKIDVSELTQNCMLGIIEEYFYGSCIISDLYIYVLRILNVCIGKILTINLLYQVLESLLKKYENSV